MRILAIVLLVFSILAAPVMAAPDGGETNGESSYDRMFAIGASVGRYAEGVDDGTNGQFFRLSWTKPKKHDFRISGGRQDRLGESTLGIGASFGKFLTDKTKVTIGLGTSSGELAPKWTGSTSIRRTFGKVPVTLGYLHDHWESGARHDRVSLGAQRWLKHLIFEGAARYNWNDPGDQTGWGGNVGLTWYRWKDLYIGGGYNFGKVRYLPVGPSPLLVDYDAEGYYLTFSKWFRKKSGINIRLGHAKEPEHNGIQVSWFTEW